MATQFHFTTYSTNHSILFDHQHKFYSSCDAINQSSSAHNNFFLSCPIFFSLLSSSAHILIRLLLKYKLKWYLKYLLFFIFPLRFLLVWWIHVSLIHSTSPHVWVRPQNVYLSSSLFLLYGRVSKSCKIKEMPSFYSHRLS